MNGKRLLRSATDKKICGVCGGIAEYFNIDATLVRLLWAILSIFPGSLFGGLFVYIVAAVIIPEDA